MTKSLEITLTVNVGGTALNDYGITNNKAATNVNLSQATKITAADELFHESGTIADAATKDFDLLTEVDPFGDVINLQSIYLLIVKNTTGAGGAGLYVGDGTGALANAWTACFGPVDSNVRIPAGGFLALPFPAGLTVDATHKVLRLEHDGVGAANVTYEIIVAGLIT